MSETPPNETHQATLPPDKEQAKDRPNAEHSEQEKAPVLRGIIAYFAKNTVAANLLMMFIIIMGLISYFTIQRQMFPNVEINYILIDAQYPGASPQEIEESILIKIEESLKDVTEIKRSISKAWRHMGSLELEVDPTVELTDVLNRVKSRVDSISTFPLGMEPITINQAEFQQDVIELSLVGDRPLTELKPIAKKIEDDLLQLSNVSLVRLEAPPEEIGIEIKPEFLKAYNLTMAEVVQSIQNYSANYSAGQINADSGTVSIRIENQKYLGQEFANVPIKIGQNGEKLRLRDIAVIKDGFTEGERYFKYSGKNAIYLSVKATKQQNMVSVADSVRSFVEARQDTLPSDLELKILVDMTYYLNARLDMMLDNLLQGAILVALMLSLFLRFRLALWVMVGLPVCFLGAVLVMPFLGVSINILSLFAFIMVLGIVVDDAIVIGESAYTEIENKGSGIHSVVRGAQKVAVPATFGVLTTVAVFLPFTQTSGPEGTFFFNISVVVILCLLFSLVESKLILPAHLAHSKFDPLPEGHWRSRFNHRFQQFVNVSYRNFIERCTRQRWLVLCVFLAILIISIGMIMGNYIRMVPTPKVPHDFPKISINMSDTVSDQATIEVLKTIEQVVMDVEKEVEQEYGRGMVKDLLAYNKSRTEAALIVPLVDEEARPFDTFELANRWRAAFPEMPGVKSISVQDDVNGDHKKGDFGYNLYGEDIESLQAAGREFMAMLQKEKGLYDLSSTIDLAGKEIQLSLKPVAFELGLNLSAIANQLGSSFYGAEAQRIIRDGEEVRVMVRYPQLTREQFSKLKYSLITTPQGNEVMLGDVVNLVEKPGVNHIRREGGYRSVYIWGAIDQNLVEPNALVEHVNENLLPKLQAEYPGVKSKLGGSIEEQRAQQNQQLMFFIAGMIMVFILLAVPLKSYGQPLIIMSVIPFSLTGAIWGHFFFGLDLSMMSTFGLIAAAGVVINDSLVMTDYVNQCRRDHNMPVHLAVIEAGCARFRAITLTSITTFVGVLPILFESSLQARFVIPMAVALGFAVLYATLITLILVPCLYLILDDMKRLFMRIFMRSKITTIEESS